MRKEKKIEEMARVLCHAQEPCSKCVWGRCDVEHLAIDLYNAGYRKQSEGEWIAHIEIGAMNNFWECSVCGWKTVSFTEMRHSKYCPNCGAKMKGGE